ncbi:MAG TPA: xanthine dehydrogenase family protein molybdopterin-binding subunit [Beijerinckiaceae bacterium]|nr:xanthine dehydrogenase family protein molybdopterin-binding subunit [Beijerinckiaceae bacterium]
MNAAAPEPKANMGRPEPRIDGRLKVTGEAHYPSDISLNDPVYAFLVTSVIARGRIKSLTLEPARAVPGVLDILTYETVGDAVKPAKFFSQGGHVGSSIRPLSSAQIAHDGQIVAIVLADSFEAAREAAYAVGVDYAEKTPSATFDSPGSETVAASKASKDHKDPAVGDAEAALASADVVIDEKYATSAMHHNALELFTTSCVWADDQLTIYEPSQFVYGMKYGVAEQLGIDPNKVRVHSEFIGGAFGGKGSLTQRTALIALAARRLNRPVKLVATRGQGYTIATYRAETRHHIRLGATRAGNLTAYAHEGSEVTSRPDPYKVGGTQDTCRMYAFGAVATKVSMVHADRNTPGFMRSPPETPYMYALENAMDEMAVKLGMDPIAFRRMNDTQSDPVSGKAYTSRSLMQCYDEAAKAFGWSNRKPQPGAMRDGDWLVGWGCATAVYPTHTGPATARVRLSADGQVLVQTAAHEIGTGAYTVIGQAAAERLGVALGAVRVELGDSALPPAPVAGGSNTTASVSSVVIKACDAIREKLFRAATTANDGPLSGRPAADLTLSGSAIRDSKGASEPLKAVFARLGAGMIEDYAEFTPQSTPPDGVSRLYKGVPVLGGGSHGKKMMFAFGAELVEVRIHARTREIRVPRLVGAFAGGRIANPRTARSQLMGGMIWGVGHALHEKTEIDERAARYVNRDLADYLIPVNADIQQLEVILVPEVDEEVNPAGMKGLGELGNVGTAAAIASAVYHATGIRVRHTPIRLEDLLGG